MIFFGGCALVYVLDGRRSAVFLRLDSSGLESRHPGAGVAFRVGWPQVAAVRVAHDERSSTVVVTLRGPENPSGDAAPDRALARGASSPLVPPEVGLSPAALGLLPESLAAEIERFRRYYTPLPFSTSIVARPAR